MEKKKSVNKITLINLFSTVLLQGIAFISAPIISRLLGTEDYGIISIYTTWVSVAAIAFSGQTSSTLHLAMSEYPKEDQLKYQSSMIGLSITIFLIASAIVAIFSGQISNALNLPSLMLTFLLVQAYGQSCASFLNAKYTYEFDADKNMYMSTFISVSVFALSVLFIINMPLSIRYWGRIAAMTMVYALIGVICSVFLFQKGKTFYNGEYWKFALPLSLPIVFHSLSGIILGHSDRVMLQQMTTNAMVGIYSLAASFGGILVAIWSALNNCWCPFLFEYLRTNQYQKIVNHGKNYLELYTILTIGFMLLAPEVFHVFAATEYWGGTDLIPVFAYNAYFGFLYAFPVNYQFYLKKTKLIAVGTVVAGICNIIMNWFFIQWWHISGAALATMFSSVLLFLFHHFIVIKTCKLEYPFHLKMLAPYAFVVLVIFTIVMTNIFSWPIRWGIGVLIGVWEFYRIVRRKSIF